MFGLIDFDFPQQYFSVRPLGQLKKIRILSLFNSIIPRQFFRSNIEGVDDQNTIKVNLIWRLIWPFNERCIQMLMCYYNQGCEPGI